MTDIGWVALAFAAGVVITLAVARLIRGPAPAHPESADRTAADRELLKAVQTGVLPVIAPNIDGVRVSAAYRMAGRAGGPIGGDFYVFVPLEDKTIGIGIGDVAGHGPAAVAAMANARLTLRAIASITPEPSLALSRTEFVLRRTGNLDFLSVLYGVLDPAQGIWTQVNAGHTPPIVRRRDGSTSLFAGGSSSVLGAQLEPSTFTSGQLHIEEGDLLVLYTDGLVERRDVSIDHGIARACDVITRHADPATLTSALMDTVGAEPADDVAVVVVELGAVPAPPAGDTDAPGRRYLRRPTHVWARPARDGEVVQTPLGTWVATTQDWVMTTELGAHHLIPARTFEELYLEDDAPTLAALGPPPGAPVRRRFDPAARSVGAARSFVRTCIEDLDLDHDAAVLLTSELVSNAVVHAHTPFEVSVTATPERVRVAVADDDRSDVQVLTPPMDAEHGRGLALVAALASAWGTDLTSSGKTVWFEVTRTHNGRSGIGHAPSVGESR
jgi:anti-sigma regulatory factor (Ser/Thr protein kinase)